MVGSFDSYFVLKYQEHLLWPDLSDSKKFENLCIPKLQTTITFAPGIRITIIIYVFGVEKFFPYRGSLPKAG